MAELKGGDFFGGAFLAEGGRSPSVLHGGLFTSPFSPSHSVPLLAWTAFVALVAWREYVTVNTLKSQTLYGGVHKQDLAAIDAEWPWGVAGDDDFDPLGLYGLLGKDAVGRYCMRELEINHGRAAMLAVLSYVAIEATFHIPVTSLTPFLFGKWYW